MANEEPNPNNAISDSATIGIIVGGIAAIVLVLGFIAILLLRTRRQKKTTNKEGSENNIAMEESPGGSNYTPIAQDPLAVKQPGKFI